MGLARFLEVPNYGGSTGTINRLINDDIRPLPPSRRTWTATTYLTWWSIWQLSLTSFQLGASLVAIGLSVWQAMLAIILARALTCAIAVLNGMPGAEWHIGYPVLSRSIWGIYGAYIPMVIRMFLTFVGMGVQTFIGGLCITAILGALSPDFLSMTDTIPMDQSVTPQQLIGWIIFNVVAAALLYIRPEKSKRTILILSGISFVVMFGIMVWAVSQARGGGPLLSAPSQAQEGSQLGWAFLGGISIAYGGTVIASTTQADFSRFARAPGDQIGGQWISFCVVGVITPLFGCLTASATAALYKQPIWNPPVLALTWLATDYSASSRAGAFFVGFGLVCSQLGITIVDNGYSAGMDLAGIFPRYINIRRGSYIALVLGMGLVPWKIVSSAQSFVAVIGSFPIFIAPIAGMQIADYWILRQRKLKLSDLYKPTSTGVYYYSVGFNWRALIAWIVGFVPCLPGLITSVQPSISISDGLVHIFQLTWIYSFLSGMLVYWALTVMIQVPGLGEYDEFDDFGTFTKEEAAGLSLQSHICMDCMEDKTSGVVQVVAKDQKLPSLML